MLQLISCKESNANKYLLQYGCCTAFTHTIPLLFWKDINAFLAVLKVQENLAETQIFIILIYTGILWDNGSLDHWLIKHVVFLDQINKLVARLKFPQ